MSLTKKQIRRNWKLYYALKSGKYRQTTGALARIIAGKRCYCVQGLACELSKLGKWRSHYGWLEYMHYGGLVPPEMQKHYGWPDDLRVGLMLGNDLDGLTFPQIADKLEAWLIDQINMAEAA